MIGLGRVSWTHLAGASQNFVAIDGASIIPVGSILFFGQM